MFSLLLSIAIMGTVHPQKACGTLMHSVADTAVIHDIIQELQTQTILYV